MLHCSLGVAAYRCGAKRTAFTYTYTDSLQCGPKRKALPRHESRLTGNLVFFLNWGPPLCLCVCISDLYEDVEVCICVTKCKNTTTILLIFSLCSGLSHSVSGWTCFITPTHPTLKNKWSVPIYGDTLPQGSVRQLLHLGLCAFSTSYCLLS